MTGTQRFITNKTNEIVNATILSTTVRPVSNAILELPEARDGNATLSLTGAYTGAEETTFLFETMGSAVAPAVVSAPTFAGSGNGILTNISTTGMPSETISVELVSLGQPEVKAVGKLAGVSLKALGYGASGNAITLKVNRSGLVFTPQPYSLLREIGSDVGKLDGAEFDWDTKLLLGDGTIPLNAHRVSFGSDKTNIYLMYKTFEEGNQYHHFVPKLRRSIPKGAIVNFVTGSYSLSVLSGAVIAETYNGIVTVYDALIALKNGSTNVIPSGLVTLDRTPEGQAAQELNVNTDAYVSRNYGNGSPSATGFSNVVVGALAGTELIVATCYAAKRDEAINASIGAELWKVEGTLSGEIAASASSGDTITIPNCEFTIPRKVPSGFDGGNRGDFNVVEIAYKGERTPEAPEPPICPTSLTLGVNSFSQSIVLTYTKRPISLADCVCSGMSKASFDAACLGLNINQGGNMAYTAPTVARLIDLYSWTADVTRASSTYANSVGIAQAYIDTGVANLLGITQNFEMTLSAVDKLGAGAQRTAAEATWDLAFAELKNDILGATNGGLIGGSPAIPGVPAVPAVAATAGTPAGPLTTGVPAVAPVLGSYFVEASPTNYSVAGFNLAASPAFVIAGGLYGTPSAELPYVKRDSDTTIPSLLYTALPAISHSVLKSTIYYGFVTNRATAAANGFITVATSGLSVPLPVYENNVLVTTPLVVGNQYELNIERTGISKLTSLINSFPSTLIITYVSGTAPHLFDIVNNPTYVLEAGKPAIPPYPSYPAIPGTAGTAGRPAIPAVLEVFGISSGAFKTMLNNIIASRHRTRLNHVLIAGGISPLGKDEADILGDGCWLDLDTTHWWVINRGEYLPAFTNVPYVSSKKVGVQTLGGQIVAGTGGNFSTKEFGFIINVKCPQHLVAGDEIILAIGNAGYKATYQAGDSLTLEIVAATPLYLSGGVNYSNNPTWSIRGENYGPFPPYVYNEVTNAPYNNGNLIFSIVNGTLPFVKNDRFVFTTEQGEFRYASSVGGVLGAWSAYFPVADAPFTLPDGLTGLIEFGAFPNFNGNDEHSFRALQPYAISNLRVPNYQAWEWGTASAVTIAFDLGSVKVLDSFCIAFLSNCANATVTVELNNTSGVSPALVSIPLDNLKTMFLKHLAIPVSGRYVRLVVTNAPNGAIGWFFAGQGTAFNFSAEVSLSLKYIGAQSGASFNSPNYFQGSGTGASVRWPPASLDEVDVLKLTDLLNYLRKNDSQAFVFMPQSTRPEGYLMQANEDSIDIVDVYGYQPNVGVSRRLEATIGLTPVYSRD